MSKLHYYAVRGMGAVDLLHLPYPAEVGQHWKWVCDQVPDLFVPGMNIRMGDTFRVDRCVDGEEPDPSKLDFSKRYRTCFVTLVGNKNSDSAVPDATGLLDYSL